MKRLINELSNKDLANIKTAIDDSSIVAITDKNGIITYANRKFCAISKYSEEELIGSSFSIVNSKYHSKEFFVEMWQTISKGKIWEGEIRNRAKDGSLYWIHTTIVPFMDENNEPEQYVAVRYDITKKKLAEEQLRVYAKKLEISNQELQDFASVAAHDLQEPLRKMQAFSDRLKMKAVEDLTPEALDYVDRIQKSAKRMQGLINDLLTYSRVTTKAQPFSPLDLNQIFSQVISDLEIQIEQSGGKIEVATLPTIEGDSTQMHQLFQNLIGNALKFTKPNIPPYITVAAKIFELSPLGHSGAACQISIQDNGIGFDEKYLDRIFTIFQRLHGRHEYEGTGIGLAVCRKIIDRHGGMITAKSTPNMGATFLVTLPMKQNPGANI